MSAWTDQRDLSLVRLLSEKGPMRTAEVARRMGYTRRHTLGVLESLRGRRLVSRVERDRRYRCSPGNPVWVLGQHGRRFAALSEGVNRPDGRTAAPTAGVVSVGGHTEAWEGQEGVSTSSEHLGGCGASRPGPGAHTAGEQCGSTPGPIPTVEEA